MALPKRKRDSRRDVDLKKPDEFISFTTRLLTALGDNRKPVVIGLGTLLVVVFALTGLQQWSETQAASRSATFTGAVQLLRAPVEDAPAVDDGAAADPANPPESKDDDGPRFSSAAERAQAVLTELAALDGSSGVGALALLARAAASLDSGDIDAAVTAYRAFGASGASDDFRFFALDGLVTALVEKGDHDGALAAAKEMEALGGGAYSDHAAFLSAGVFEARGDAAGAREAYRGLIEKHSESTLKALAQMRLDQLGG